MGWPATQPTQRRWKVDWWRQNYSNYKTLLVFWHHLQSCQHLNLLKGELGWVARHMAWHSKFPYPICSKSESGSLAVRSLVGAIRCAVIIKSKSAGGEVRPNQVPSSSGEARAIAKEMRVGEMTRVQLMALSSDIFPFAFFALWNYIEWFNSLSASYSGDLQNFIVSRWVGFYLMVFPTDGRGCWQWQEARKTARAP